MKRKSYSGFTSKTPENLLLDAGAFFKNFTYEPGGDNNDTFESAKAAGKLLGATKGGGEFSAVPTIRQIEVDGVKGRAKGLETIDAWDVYIKATILEVKTDSIVAALAAAEVDDETDDTYDVITGKSDIELEDYIDNITWVGTLKGSSEPVIIQVFNGLNTDGLKMTVQDKNEATIPVTFYGHYLDTPPFNILYPKADDDDSQTDSQQSSQQGSTTP